MKSADGIGPHALALGHTCAACRARHFGLCQIVPDDDLETVERLKTGERSLAQGEHLYHEGALVGQIFNLLDGWIALYHLLPDGRRQIIEFLLPGSFIGYQPDRLAPVTHSAECITDVTVCTFPRGRFPDFLREHPEFAIRMINMCARNHLLVHQHLTDLGRRTALERTAHFLLEFYVRLDQRGHADGSGTISMPLKQEDIADALGLSRVRVNRVLRALSERRLVETRRNAIRVRGPRDLARLANVSIVGDADAAC